MRLCYCVDEFRLNQLFVRSSNEPKDGNSKREGEDLRKLLSTGLPNLKEKI